MNKNIIIITKEEIIEANLAAKSRIVVIRPTPSSLNGDVHRVGPYGSPWHGSISVMRC